MFAFLRTRQWVVGRRILLILVVIAVAYRNYGGGISGWFRATNDAQRDILITRAEFQNNQPGERPIWILNFRNSSSENTYDQIQLEAIYVDATGTVLEKDKLVVKQVLPPGATREVPSLDSRARGSAVNATVTVIDATKVERQSNK